MNSLVKHGNQLKVAQNQKLSAKKPIQAGPSEADLKAMGSSVADDDDVPF